MLIVATGNRQQFAAHRLVFHLPIGELRHGDIDDNVSAFTRHGQDQRIVADTAVFRAPGRHVRLGVGPADADATGFRSLPAVAATTQPVVGIAHRHPADTELARQFNGPIHRQFGIDVAQAQIAVPAFEGTEALGFFGLGLEVDIAFVDVFNNPWETIDTV